MTDRQRNILTELVTIYIKTGRPTSSRMLAARLPFTLSAPSVRLELACLEKEGYVTQPHISSGSIPTPQAFRAVFRDALAQRPQQISANKRTAIGTMSEAIPYLARQTRLVAFGHDTDERVCMMGFHYLVALPEFQDKQTLSGLFEIIDRLGGVDAEGLFGFLPGTGEPAIFIGSENPFVSSELFGMVASRIPDGQLLAVLGPVRMDYRRTFGLVNDLVMNLQKNFYG